MASAATSSPLEKDEDDPMDVDEATEEDPNEDADADSDDENDNDDDNDSSTSSDDDDDDDDNDGDDDSDSNEGDNDDDDDDDDEDTEEEEEEDEASQESPPKKSVAVAAHSILRRPTPPSMAKKLSALSSPSLAHHPPKMRIKLSLKLPTKANRPKEETAAAATAATRDEETDDEDSAVKATVAASDEEGAEAAVIPENKMGATKRPPLPSASLASSSTTNKPSGHSKRRSTHPSRPIKMPPISSPSLLMIPPPGTLHPGHPRQYHNNDDNNHHLPKVTTNKDGLTTPEQVFQHTMAVAGYSHERRTEDPHRGSSVSRVVGDLFDSNVKLALHFPELVPRHLMSTLANDKDDDDDRGEHKDSSIATVDLPQLLIRGLEFSPKQRKRKLDTFRDMIPVSLTMNYPTDYIEKYLDYVDSVQAREKAIVAWQDAQDDVFVDAEEIKKSIPPIPEPPGPPLLSECHDSPFREDCSQHPIYIPKAAKDKVAHLDPEAFHVTTGRYFGLRSNTVADPNFYGPNAPGIAGAQGTGLSLSSGSTSTSVTALTLSSSAFTKTFGPYAAKATLYFGAKTFSASSLAATTHPVEPADGWNVLADQRQDDGHVFGPQPTATLADLAAVLQEQPALRQVLWRAAVRAVRSGRDGESFALQDKIYPNVRRAFSLHSGVESCLHCQLQKRGVRVVCRIELLFEMCVLAVLLVRARIVVSDF